MPGLGTPKLTTIFWTDAANHYEKGVPSDTFVQLPWNSYGRAMRWCTNFNSNDKPALQQAINDWMAAFPSSFGNEFVEGSPCELNFQWSPVNPGCESGAWACVVPSKLDDSVRGGKYLTGATVYFVGFQSWNYDRYRAIAAHELGHVHNLWEQYYEGSFGCYGGTTSIMDTNIPGLQDCENPPIVGPTVWDKSMANWVYTLRPADLPGAGGGVGQFTWWFGDINYSENHVAVHIRRNDGSTYGQLVLGYQRIEGIAPGDGQAWTAISDTWSRGSSPPGQYRACFAPWNWVVNNYPYYDCTPWVNVN